jgi:hypothetical protein
VRSDGIACVVGDRSSWLPSMLGCVALVLMRIWQQQELLAAFDARLHRGCMLTKVAAF